MVDEVLGILQQIRTQLLSLERLVGNVLRGDAQVQFAVVKAALDLPHIVVASRKDLSDHGTGYKTAVGQGGEKWGKEIELPAHNDPRILVQRAHVQVLAVGVVAAPLVNEPLDHLAAREHDQALLAELEREDGAVCVYVW